MKVVEENPNPSLQDFHADEADDDTASLSEFLLYHETFVNGDDEKPLIEDHDTFEFFKANELDHNQTNIKNHFPPENIVFCGSIIHTKKPIPKNTPNLKDKYQSSSLSKHQNTKRRIDDMKKGGHGKHIEHKVTILRSSTRWHLYAFGMTKVPLEMELSDIKSRQSRRRLRPIDDQSRGPVNKLFESEKVSVGCSNTSTGKGLWRVLRGFGCKDHANTMVKASLVCIPRI